MAYLSLYRKYRPQTFAALLGQEHVARTLANAIDEDRVAHAYLFTGPRGTGKTSTARILAKALNCTNGPTSEPCGKCDACVAITEGSSLDVLEMDAASHSGVDDTREILAGVALASVGGRKKVYVIDEVHMLTTQSFNALLKTLEEPPEHVIFVLATTEAHRVLPTIVSRTQRFDFRRVPADVIEKHLTEVAQFEGIGIDAAGISLLARHAEGSVRDALSGLDQLSSYGRDISETDVESLFGHRSEETFLDLFDAIARSDVAAVFSAIQTFVAQGADIRQLADDAIAHLRSLLLLKTAPDAEGLLDVPAEDRPKLSLQAQEFSGATLLRTLDLLGDAAIEMRNAPNHRLLLEIALVRAAAPETDPAATGLLGRIERLERRIGIEGAVTEAAAGVEDAVLRSDSPRDAGAPERAAGGGDDALRSDSPRGASKRSAPLRNSPGAAPPSSPPPKRASERREPEARDEGTASDRAQAVTGNVAFADIKDAWSVTMKEVNKISKRVGAYLYSSRPLRLGGDRLLVATQSDFHARQMKQESNSAVFADALFAALGVRPPVDFLAPGGEPEAPPIEEPDGTDVADTESAVDVEEDPVELVKRGLSAEVVEEKSN